MSILGDIKKEYKEYFRKIKESKKEISWIITIFIIAAIFGILIPLPEVVLKIILDRLREILEMFEGKNLIETVLLIFFNNSWISLLGLIFGVLLGILPILYSIQNGFFLGFVMKMSIEKRGILSLWRILPHGIFELPAVWISLGLGLKLGKTFIKNRKKLKQEFIESLKVFLFVVIPLLFIAAIIEGVLIFYLR